MPEQVFEVSDTASTAIRPVVPSTQLPLTVTVKLSASPRPAAVIYDVVVIPPDNLSRPFKIEVPESAASPAQAYDPPAETFRVTVVGEPGPRPKGLVWLYGAFLGLSTADGALTWFNIRHGAAEQNPLIGSGNRAPSLFGMKIGSSVSTIFFAERLRREHPRRALVVMAAINGAMSWVVWRNEQISRKIRHE